MRTEILCVSVLRVASGPRLASCKSALNPMVVYSTDLLRRWSWYCSHSLYCFSVCVVMLALWSPSSIAAYFAFCFASCVVILAF